MVNDSLKLNTALVVRISVIQLAIGVWDEIINSTLQNVLVLGFGKTESFKGGIIAASQLLTMLLLPVWGSLSDRCTAKRGRRTPFILAGGFVCAAVLALSVLFLEKPSLVPFLVCFFLCAVAVCMMNPAATALVPDLTPKPLNANASVINRIICSLGGAWIVILIFFFDTDFTVIYLTAAGTILNFTLFYLFAVPENRLLQQQKDILEKYNGANNHTQASLRVMFKNLSTDKKRSFAGILTANFFAKLSYYAFSSAYLNYAVTQWNMKYAHTSMLTIAIYLSGLVSILLTAKIAAKTGRKRTLFLSYAFMLAGFMLAAATSRFGFAAILSLLLIGIGWSMESVIPLPMLMEMTDAGNVGIVTSVYTDSCKLGRVVGPFLTGFLLDSRFGYKALYPFAVLAVLPTFATMPLIRHGNVQEVQNEE